MLVYYVGLVFEHVGGYANNLILRLRKWAIQQGKQ